MVMKLLAFLTVTILSLSSIAQSSNTDWLYQRFTQEDAEAIVNAGGDKLAFYLFVNENGCKVSDVSPKPIDEYADATLVQAVNPSVPPLTVESLISGEFDCELYNWGRSESETRYFKVGSTGYLLMVQPNAVLRSKFSAQ